MTASTQTKQQPQQNEQQPQQQQPEACPILRLTLEPLHLDLLGLVIDLDRVDLNITAKPGNLLGNLLCALSNLLSNVLGNVLGSVTETITDFLQHIVGGLLDRLGAGEGQSETARAAA